MSTENSKAKLACIWLIFLFIQRARCFLCLPFWRLFVFFCMQCLFSLHHSKERAKTKRERIFSKSMHRSPTAHASQKLGMNRKDNNSKQKTTSRFVNRKFIWSMSKGIDRIFRTTFDQRLDSFDRFFGLLDFQRNFRLLCSQLAKVLSKWNFSWKKKLVHWLNIKLNYTHYW